MKRKHAFLYLNIVSNSTFFKMCLFPLTPQSLDLSSQHHALIKLETSTPSTSLSLPLIPNPLHLFSQFYFLFFSEVSSTTLQSTTTRFLQVYILPGERQVSPDRVLSHLKGTHTFRSEVIIKTTKHQQQQRAPCIWFHLPIPAPQTISYNVSRNIFAK